MIADSVETVMFAERLDGSVLLAGCDKSLPGMLMAAARLDLASVFLYAGTSLPGRLDGRGPHHHRHRSRASARARAGLMTRDELGEIERATCPGEGACGGHVHRQHDGQRGRSARDVAARAAPRRRPTDRGATSSRIRSGEAVVG